jgi:four helix bundle protein
MIDNSAKTVRHFTDLEVWRKSHNLFLETAKDIKNVSGTNEVARIIISQITRSIGAISANIAEGFNAVSTKEYIHYLDIARRSTAESENWFYKLRDCGLLNKDKVNIRIRSTLEIARMLQGLIKALVKNRRLVVGKV